MTSKILTIALALLLLSCVQDDTSISPTAQLEIDVQKIDEFLVANPGDPGDIIVKDASGIRLVITELGSGIIPPNSGNDLKVAYTGRLFSNGSVFDSNNAFFLKLSDNVITGWKIGLSLMTEGTRAKLYIPSGYAYGPNGQGTIPGNSILVFDIYLESVVPTQQQIDKIASDSTAIDLQLEADQVANVQKHDSGLRYVVTQPGTGATPGLYSQVRINYKGTLFADGTVFQNTVEVKPDVNFSSRVVNYIHGVVIGLQLLQEGGKATFYVPSTLAYGTREITGVPANSIVVVEIELLEVIN